ncbi:MAG: cytochrome c-type biogenesis protein CcmH [Anaerolineae bacterium]|nr:cytochrome c-type biogenesis protein CcmH [Anaerolineae bacterium]
MNRTVKRCQRIILWAALASVIVLAGGIGLRVDRAAAQGGQEQLPPGVTWDEVNAIAHKMYCDVCEGVPLDECESIACHRWREEIARLISEGKTEDEIIDYFVTRYGTDVAALPRDSQDRFLAFAIPAGLVALLGVIGAVQVWRMRQHGHHAGQAVSRTRGFTHQRPVPDDVDPDTLDRLLGELEGMIHE